ncbi:MAG: KxYKxGKxW signal peptide domain-containing protein [Thermonemataceae bacterium]
MYHFFLYKSGKLWQRRFIH